MADETPKKKKTIPLPPKKEEPAPAAKQETLDEKIARLEKEAKLAKLEKEATARNRPPVIERAKEAIKAGVEKTKTGLGKAAGVVKQKTGKAPTRSPITGRMVEPPSLFEKGIESLADVTNWFANKAKTAVTGQTIEESIREGMTPEQKAAQSAKDAKRFSAVKQSIANQAKEQRLNTPSPNLNVGPDKQVVVSTSRGKEGVVPASLSKKAALVPLEERIQAFSAKLDRFIRTESPLLNARNVDKSTVPQGAIEGAKNKLKGLVGGDATAEDFIVKSLNRSGDFTPDEVPKIARTLVTDPTFRTTLEESQLFDAYERPNNRLSGGAPKPIDRRTSAEKPSPAAEPTLQERLARFQENRVKQTQLDIENATKALAPYGDPQRDARIAGQAAEQLAPYGGKGPSVATGPQTQLELRNEIETRARGLAAQRAQAEVAKQATRARVEGANNQAEQAFLQRLAREREALNLAEGNATWDIRTPAELATASSVGAGGPSPSNLGRMDRLREIAMLNAQTPEEYALQNWLRSRAPLNNVSTAGGAPLRGIVAESAPTRFLNMGRMPTLGGLGVAGTAVGGVLAPLQIYEQIKSANSSDPIEAGYGASDPFALRGLMDLALDPTVGGMTAKAAGRSYEKKANDPRYIEKSPLTSAVGQAARGNPAYLKALVNNLAYYGDSPYGWGLFSDEQPRNLNEQGAR